jgi:hypothetical protein
LLAKNRKLEKTARWPADSKTTQPSDDDDLIALNPSQQLQTLASVS